MVGLPPDTVLGIRTYLSPPHSLASGSFSQIYSPFAPEKVNNLDSIVCMNPGCNQ